MTLHRRAPFVLVIPLVFLGVFGCDPAPDDVVIAGTSFVADETQAMSIEAISRPPEIEVASFPVSLTSSQEAEPRTDRVIRNGEIVVEVDDLDEATEAASGVAEAAGGYVARNETRSGANGSRSGTVVLRVPAEGFDRAFASIAELGSVRSSSVGIANVSRQYYDIETRLAVREETVGRLRELASEGGGLDDLLAIERELGRAVEQLEALKGELRFLDLQIAESDLRITLVEHGAALPRGALAPLSRALRDAAATFVRSLAGLIYVVVAALPWLVLALLVGGLVRRWLRRRTGARKVGADGSEATRSPT